MDLSLKAPICSSHENGFDSIFCFSNSMMLSLLLWYIVRMILCQLASFFFFSAKKSYSATQKMGEETFHFPMLLQRRG